jgi:RNA polymerase-binding transcription factor DksA
MSTNKKKSVTKKVAKVVKPAKSVATKKVAKKTVAKKTAAKKVVVKKAAVKETATKKVASKKSVIAKPAVKKVVKKVISSKTKAVDKDKNAPVKAAVSKVKIVAKSISKTKEMKKEDKEKASKDATPQVPKNMPLLRQEPAYLQRTMNAPKDDRTHYSKEELKEFEAIILEKLELARKQFQFAKDVLNRKNDEGTDNTTGNIKMLEDGADVLEKESFSSFAARQQKFILQLENAHTRIKNGTYGICIVTGKLIPKERLKLVPHTQHTIEAKEQRK